MNKASNLQTQHIDVNYILLQFKLSKIIYSEFFL